MKQDMPINITVSKQNQEKILKPSTFGKKEFNQYTSPSGNNTPKSDIDYLKQSIEIDAIAFA